METLNRCIGILLSLSMCACIGGSGSDTASPYPAPIAPEPSPVVAVDAYLFSASGFDCLIYVPHLFCIGLDTQIAPSALDWTLTATGDFTNAYAYDDVLCLEASVSTRPDSRTPGTASYCIGEAALDWPYAHEPIVFGGPNFIWALHGSPELTWPTHITPFMGGDLTIDYLVNQTTYADPIIPAATDTVSAQGALEACALHTLTNTLTCVDLSLEVAL